jgi:hypothetical protein
MTSTIFWDITPCSPLIVNRRFGGLYRFHLQGRKIRQDTRALLAPYFRAGFFVGLFFDHEDGGDISLRNPKLHGVTTQKIILFILTAVRTSEPTRTLQVPGTPVPILSEYLYINSRLQLG